MLRYRKFPRTIYRQQNLQLPDFVIVGAAKCGTTSIHHNLLVHPEIHMPSKEVHYFDWRPTQHPISYSNRVTGEIEEGYSPKIIGEKTPTYLYYRQCHERMHQTLPEAKLILMLRNPADRWISEWKMKSQREDHWFDPHPLIDEQIKRFDEELAEPISDLGHHLPHGYYWFSIKHLLQFYPREQLHVVITEDLAKDPSLEYNKIFKFLGVSPHEGDWVKRLAVRRKVTGLSVRRRLVEYYKPFNQELADGFGIDPPEWSDVYL